MWKKKNLNVNPTICVIFISDLHLPDVEFLLQFEVSRWVGHRGSLNVWFTQDNQTIKQKHVSLCWFTFCMFHKNPIWKKKLLQVKL